MYYGVVTTKDYEFVSNSLLVFFLLLEISKDILLVTREYCVTQFMFGFTFKSVKIDIIYVTNFEESILISDVSLKFYIKF